MGAIKFGAADAQRHVQNPVQKQTGHGRRPSGKVKAEALEVILEKEKEEDLAASMGQNNYKSGQP